MKINHISPRFAQIFVHIFACVLVVCGVATLLAHPPDQNGRHLADREPDQRLNAKEEAFVHTPKGFRKPGKPKKIAADDTMASTLKVRIFDKSSGKLTACRVNVVGSDGNYYEPDVNLLKDWSRQRTNPGETHGPSRYFGWHFYTTGRFEVRIPAGKTRVEIWKGLEYRPTSMEVVVPPGRSREVDLKIDHVVPMEKLNYYSGDTHIHLNRTNQAEDQRALDLMAAEDLRFGFILCMNNPPSYSGIMSRQEWPQLRGFGPSSVLTRDRWGIASGQEYRTSTYGHICLLMHDRMVLEGRTVTANNGPAFEFVGRETKRLGGISFHAHGGYSAEIYADYIHQSTDGVELLQMAHYRGIGLTGWYRILNCGYRFPGLAGSDFPYCRCLGDCRNYVYMDGKSDFQRWAKAAAEGRSFFTTGPFVVLTVNKKRPGDVIQLASGDMQQLDVHIRVRSEVAPVQRVEIVMGGKTVHSLKVPAQSMKERWFESKLKVKVDQPTWIAARAFGISSTGRPDAEAHTNPVYVDLDGRQAFNTDDRDWLVKKLEGRISVHKRRNFPEKSQILQVFESAREKLLKRSENTK